jgi:hypothetical protein
VKDAICVLDSDVFIAAKNLYYAFDIVPGFWDAIVEAHGHDRARSIDRVRAELLAAQPKENLVVWAKTRLPAGFFHSTQTKSVIDAYTEIATWVQRSTQYMDHAKAKFATEADGWLVAYSMVHGTTVVTNEQPSPGSKNRVMLPDLCNQFGVSSKNTFSMLRSLGTKLELRS